MLVFVIDYGDEVPETLIGGFETREEIEAKIKEIEEADAPMGALDGGEFVIIDTKKHEYWTFVEGDTWVKLDNPEDEEPEHDDDPDNELIDGVGFADPGGKSALRAATKDNPRDRPCPNCGKQNVLTRIDVANGYQCDECADRAERGVD
jgi:hypothetical protein